MKANCPSCGAEVLFKSSVSVFSVCDFCKSMIVRHDMDLEALGKMAQIPDDVSPLQLGSRGKYNNNAFEVVGRLKIGWSEGYWNEWFLMYENGKSAWLAEAMGFFMISTEVKATDRVPKQEDIAVGGKYELAPSKFFYVDDIKEAVCIGSQGELPFKGLHGRKTLSVDLSNFSGEFLNIEYSDQDGVRLYLGRYVEFEELGLSNLRDIEADIKKIRSAETFKCPSCGGPFSMLTPGLTASVACKYCGSTIDTTNQTLALLSKAEEKMKIKPLIPIGAKGKLSNITWEVTGFMRRSDASGMYEWDEYLLFNPYKGFRWLTTYNGHWNYVEMMRSSPVRGPLGAEVKFREKTFKKFLTGQGKVVFVVGEFYWRVKLGDTVALTDYICPPEILSCESDGLETVWSVGTYTEPEAVGQAFGIKEEMPRKEGVAANQPSPYAGVSLRVALSFAAFAAFLTLLQFYFIAASPNKEVYRGEFSFSSRGSAKSIVTPSFDIPGDSDNVEVTLHSPVKNDWMAASIDLVNEKDNTSIELDKEVEYYSGTDSDGAWSEGSQSTDLMLSSVPGGRYHLVIEPSTDPNTWAEKSFVISLRRGVTTWCNYVLAFLLLALYPICVCFRKTAFEKKRWSESDLTESYGNEGED